MKTSRLFRTFACSATGADYLAPLKFDWVVHAAPAVVIDATQLVKIYSSENGESLGFGA